MDRNGTASQVAAAKFQPLQVVRIKDADEAEKKDPGVPAPIAASMGQSGVVEMEGRVFVHDPDGGSSLEQVYFVRIEGIGPVLAGEGWLADV